MGWHRRPAMVPSIVRRPGRWVLSGLRRRGWRGSVVVVGLMIATVVLIPVPGVSRAGRGMTIVIPVGITGARRGMIVIAIRRTGVLPVAVMVAVPVWPAAVMVPVRIWPVMIMVPRVIGSRNQGNIVRPIAIAEVADLAGIISVDGISVGIECDRTVNGAVGSIDGELKTAIERQLRPDDLVGIFRTLHQILAAVDVAFGDEVGDDVPAAFDQLIRGQLVGFVDEGEQRRGVRAHRCLVVRLHDAARAEQGECAERKGQEPRGEFHSEQDGRRD